MIVLRLSGGVEFCNMLNKIRNIKYGDKNKKKRACAGMGGVLNTLSLFSMISLFPLLFFSSLVKSTKLLGFVKERPVAL